MNRSDTTDSSDLLNVRWLKVPEIADALRVSKMTVYRLVHSGVLPSMRVGRSYRVPEPAVLAYLREQLGEPGAPG